MLVGWKLTIDGLVDNPMALSIDDLKKRFEVVNRALTLECGGNGRAFFDPPADGSQWTYGAVACSEWTGVRLIRCSQGRWGERQCGLYRACGCRYPHLW